MKLEKNVLDRTISIKYNLKEKYVFIASVPFDHRNTIVSRNTDAVLTHQEQFSSERFLDFFGKWLFFNVEIRDAQKCLAFWNFKII